MRFYPEIADREWQQKGLSAAIESFLPSKEKSTFLVVACPGAGKTRFSIATMKAAAESGHVDLVVVVAPTETLRKQWIGDAAEHGISLHHYSSEDLRDAMIDGFDDGIHGVVTTYQQVAMVADVFEHFCASLKVFLVADEIHHCADHLSWGDKLQIGFNGAIKKLILSGTPFRTDSGCMPFVMRVNGEGKLALVEPDANYTYAEACDDHVCRVMTFVRVNANIRFEDDNGVWEHLLDENGLDVKFRNRMYRAALDPDRSDFSRYLLEQAWGKLKSIREKEQPEAGLLVVAKDNAHAEKLKDIMHAITGKMPVVVNSDRPGSSTKIRRFKKSRAPVIIAVKMFSEGVDAPRIRVIAFLTQAKTEMWFRQIVGRAVRMQREVGGDQPAFMYIPKIPAFEEMARRIEEEIAYIVDSRASPSEKTWMCEHCGYTNHETSEYCEECGAEKPRGVAPPPPPTIMVHGSSNESIAGFIAMGLDIDQAVTDMTAELIDGDPLLKRFQPEYVALITKAMSTNPAWAKRFEEALKPEEGLVDDDDY